MQTIPVTPDDLKLLEVIILDNLWRAPWGTDRMAGLHRDLLLMAEQSFTRNLEYEYDLIIQRYEQLMTYIMDNKIITEVISKAMTEVDELYD